jgi:hypothetical protein
MIVDVIVTSDGVISVAIVSVVVVVVVAVVVIVFVVDDDHATPFCNVGFSKA